MLSHRPLKNLLSRKKIGKKSMKKCYSLLISTYWEIHTQTTKASWDYGSGNKEYLKQERYMTGGLLIIWKNAEKNSKVDSVRINSTWHNVREQWRDHSQESSGNCGILGCIVAECVLSDCSLLLINMTHQLVMLRFGTSSQRQSLSRPITSHFLR